MKAISSASLQSSQSTTLSAFRASSRKSQSFLFFAAVFGLTDQVVMPVPLESQIGALIEGGHFDLQGLATKRRHGTTAYLEGARAPCGLIGRWIDFAALCVGSVMLAVSSAEEWSGWRRRESPDFRAKERCPFMGAVVCVILNSQRPR